MTVNKDKFKVHMRTDCSKAVSALDNCIMAGASMPLQRVIWLEVRSESLKETARSWTVAHLSRPNLCISAESSRIGRSGTPGGTIRTSGRRNRLWIAADRPRSPRSVRKQPGPTGLLGCCATVRQTEQTIFTVLYHLIVCNARALHERFDRSLAMRSRRRRRAFVFVADFSLMHVARCETEVIVFLVR